MGGASRPLRQARRWRGREESPAAGWKDQINRPETRALALDGANKTNTGQAPGSSPILAMASVQPIPCDNVIYIFRVNTVFCFHRKAAWVTALVQIAAHRWGALVWPLVRLLAT